MKKLFTKHKTARLLAVCYGLCFVLLLLWHLGCFVYNRVLRANGALQTVELTAADFALQDILELDDGTLVTIGLANDPQLIAQDATLRADSILLVATYAEAPGMVSAYWAKAPQGDHSVRNMAYARQTAEGWLMLLPAAGGVHLRVDPDVVAGNLFTIEKIVLNPPRGLLGYLRFSAGEWALLAALPLLAACAMQALARLRRVHKTTRKGGGA